MRDHAANAQPGQASATAWPIHVFTRPAPEATIAGALGLNRRFPPKAAVAGSLAPNRLTRPFSDIQAADRMAGAGRNRNDRFGARNGKKQTFVHGDWQRQPSTPNGDSMTAAATAGFDPNAQNPVIPAAVKIDPPTGHRERVDHSGDWYYVQCTGSRRLRMLVFLGFW
jgi:hypothetical protein